MNRKSLSLNSQDASWCKLMVNANGDLLHRETFEIELVRTCQRNSLKNIPKKDSQKSQNRRWFVWTRSIWVNLPQNLLHNLPRLNWNGVRNFEMQSWNLHTESYENQIHAPLAAGSTRLIQWKVSRFTLLTYFRLFWETLKNGRWVRAANLLRRFSGPQRNDQRTLEVEKTGFIGRSSMYIIERSDSELLNSVFERTLNEVWTIGSGIIKPQFPIKEPFCYEINFVSPLISLITNHRLKTL